MDHLARRFALVADDRLGLPPRVPRSPRLHVRGEKAKRDLIAAVQEAGRSVPPPSAEAAGGYSGKWQLRTPKSLHRRLAEYAEREEVSLNTLTISLLMEGLGRRAGHGNGSDFGSAKTAQSYGKTQ
jgi:hypothetical protein